MSVAQPGSSRPRRGWLPSPFHLTNAPHQPDASGASMSESKQRPFQADVSRVLRLVVNSLYSNKEIFLRELVSNASDAIDKLRFDSLSQPELLPEGTEFRIRIVADAEKKTLTL